VKNDFALYANLLPVPDSGSLSIFVTQLGNGTRDEQVIASIMGTSRYRS